MTSILRKPLSLLLALLLVFGICAQPVAVYAKEDEDPSRYGRSALARLDNANALLYAYDQIAEGVEDAEESIDVYNGKNAITQQQIGVVMDAYRRDYGEHFWMGSYMMYISGGTVTSVVPSYSFTGSELKAARKEFRQAADTILSGLDGSMTDFEKEQYIHDKLAARITYDYSSGPNSHNAYGALIEGKAVCEGYAEAFQYLLRRAGIQSFLAIGFDKVSQVGHEWNYVLLDGNYYHVDLTWNDQGADLYHAYFNLSDAQILEDHSINAAAYALPECTSDQAFYFTGKPEYLETYTVESVAQLLKANDLKVHVYIPGDVNGFLNWFNQNIFGIVSQLDMMGAFAYEYSSLGREVILSLQGDHTHVLTFVPAVAATCTKAGNVAHYVCECGSRLTDSSGIYEIADPTTDILGHDYTEKITDKAHLRDIAKNCQDFDSYWYDCSRCKANAKNDPYADDCWYDSDTAGSHDFRMKQWGYQEDAGHAHSCALCDAHDTLIPHTPGPEATEELPQVCTECNFVLVPALNHVHALTAVEAVAATCTTEGHGAYYCCSGCPYWFADEAGTQLITDKNALIISALGHSFSQWVVYEGKELRICADCGEIEERNVQKEEPISNPFVDVAAGAFYYDPVQWAVAEGITTGLSATEFGPDQNCTRGQVVTFLWRAAGKPEPVSTANPFSDVAESEFYYKAVLWAVEKGITNGLSATQFGPNQTCTRGQVATFLHRYFREPAPSSSANPFNDVAGGAFYYNAVLWAVEQGVTNGYGETGGFAPDVECNRSQIVTFLYRAIADK